MSQTAGHLRRADAHRAATVSATTPPWRRTLGVVAAITSAAAAAGTAQLLTGTMTPSVDVLEPLGLRSWVLPGLWLAASVAVPCAVTAVLAWMRSPRLGAAALAAGALLAIELVVQVPVLGLNALQGVMGVVVAVLVWLGRQSYGATPAIRAPGRPGVAALAATALAAAAVIVDEMVLWSGQPSARPSGASITDWYSAHASRVLLGDVLWVGACLVLFAALWSSSSGWTSAWRRAFGALVVAATGALAASAFVAAWLVFNGNPDNGAHWWRVEGACYLVGTAALAVAVAALAVHHVSVGRRVAASVELLVAVALLVPPTRLWGLVLALLVVAATRLLELTP